MCSRALCIDQQFLLQMQGGCTDVVTMQELLLRRGAYGMYEDDFAFSATRLLVCYHFRLRQDIASQMTTLVHKFLVYVQYI